MESHIYPQESNAFNRGENLRLVELARYSPPGGGFYILYRNENPNVGAPYYSHLYGQACPFFYELDHAEGSRAIARIQQLMPTKPPIR